MQKITFFYNLNKNKNIEKNTNEQKGIDKMRRSVHVTYRESDGKWHVVSGDANSKSQKNMLHKRSNAIRKKTCHGNI